MKTSANGRALIEAFEGLFLKTYDDGEGVLTLGFGHTTAAGSPVVVRGMEITRERAEQMLATDLEKVEMRVERIIGQPLTQNEFDALVSFEFNAGCLGKSSIPVKIRAGRKDLAMQTLLEYDHGANTKKVYAGLARRRRAEKLMFEGDVAGALQAAGVQAQKQDSVPKSTVPPEPLPAAKPSFLSLILSIFKRS